MKAEMKFEDAITKLEQNVANLERGELSLDEAIKVYEESIKLVKICSDTLKKAEQKESALVEEKDGTIKEEEFKGLRDE